MYCDLDDIACESLRVPVRFNASVPEIGFLVDHEGAVPANTEALIPLWVAVPLASAYANEEAQTAYLDLLEPPALSEDALNVLKSEATALNLYAQCPMYTQLALTWCALFQSETLASTLYQAIRERGVMLFDSALSNSQIEGLDAYETRVYKQLARGIKEAKTWMRK